MGGFRVRDAQVLLLLVTACAGAPEPSAQPVTPAAPVHDARATRVEALLAAGHAAAAAQRWPDAEASLRQAVKNAYGFGAPWSSYRADALNELGRSVLAQGRAAEARNRRAASG